MGGGWNEGSLYSFGTFNFHFFGFLLRGSILGNKKGEKAGQAKPRRRRSHAHCCTAALLLGGVALISASAAVPDPWNYFLGVRLSCRDSLKLFMS